MNGLCECVYKYRLPLGGSRVHLAGLLVQGGVERTCCFRDWERESQGRWEDYTEELATEGFCFFSLVESV